MRYIFVFLLLAVAGGGAGYFYARRKETDSAPQSGGGILPPYRAQLGSTTNPYQTVDAGTPPPPSALPVSIYSEPYASLVYNEVVRLSQTPRELGQLRRSLDIPRAAFESISDVAQREQLLRVFTDATSVTPIDSQNFPFPSDFTEQTLKADLKKALQFLESRSGLPLLIFKALEIQNKPFVFRLYNLDLGQVAYSYKQKSASSLLSFKNFLKSLTDAQKRLTDAVSEKAARNIAANFGYRFIEYP